jgi:hypothetical protein
MPRIVTSIHDPAALARTCRALGLPPPAPGRVRHEGPWVCGWVVRLPGLRGPLVFDTLSGLVAYHPRDGAHDAYARIMHFIHGSYATAARRRWLDRRPVARQGPGRVPAQEGV